MTTGRVAGAASGAPTLRPAGVAGLAWGALLLVRGDALFRLVQGRDPVGVEHHAVVLLGGRHAVQGLIQVVEPTRLARLYAAIDLLHAASMVALARHDPARRRVTLVSGAIAAVSAGASIRAARRQHERS